MQDLRDSNYREISAVPDQSDRSSTRQSIKSHCTRSNTTQDKERVPAAGRVARFRNTRSETPEYFSQTFLEHSSDFSMVHSDEISGHYPGIMESITPNQLSDLAIRCPIKTLQSSDMIKPTLKSHLIVESINSQPIVKNRPHARRNPRQSISSLSPSQQQAVCKQSFEKMTEKENLGDRPRSLKKIRLWNLLSIGKQKSDKTWKKQHVNTLKLELGIGLGL